jgi:hypothetical protein
MAQPTVEARPAYVFAAPPRFAERVKNGYRTLFIDYWP